MARTKCDEWVERVQDWKASGLSARQFSEGKDFRAGRLRGWSCELARRKREQSTSLTKVPRLTRIVRTEKRTSSATPAPGITVKFGDVEVLITPGTERELIATVIQVLQEGVR